MSGRKATGNREVELLSSWLLQDLRSTTARQGALGHVVERISPAISIEPGRFFQAV